MNFKKKCLVCNNEAQVLMNDSILGKYKINYFLCPFCKCIFTEDPYWLDEAYIDSIASIDTGIMSRNISICNKLMLIFDKYFDTNLKVVDFGGGYGILTRMLRDRGIDAYWHDTFSKNLLSKGFEYNGNDKVDVIIAFEVIEHLKNPLETIRKIMNKTNCFIFSTLLIEKFDFKTNKEWWYFAPESGQHIFFLSETTMKKISEILSYHYSYVDGLHILHNNIRLRNIGNFHTLRRFLFKVCNKIYNLIIQDRRFKSKTWEDQLYIKSRKNNNS